MCFAVFLPPQAVHFFCSQVSEALSRKLLAQQELLSHLCPRGLGCFPAILCEWAGPLRSGVWTKPQSCRAVRSWKWPVPTLRGWLWLDCSEEEAQLGVPGEGTPQGEAERQ